jgi:hypothetical protein
MLGIDPVAISRATREIAAYSYFSARLINGQRDSLERRPVETQGNRAKYCHIIYNR